MTTAICSIIDAEESAAVHRLINAVFYGKYPIFAELGGVVITSARDIPGYEDVITLWTPDSLIDPVDIFESVTPECFCRRGGTLVCDSKALVARVLGRITEEAARLRKAQALPQDGFRHYVRTRELPPRRRTVATLSAATTAAHPYLGKPFDPSLRIPPGAMVLRIREAYPDPLHPSQVVIRWDVSEGYYAGCYANLNESRKAFLNTETINLGTVASTATAYKLQALDASNPGLNSYDLLYRGDWDGLKGRKFGGVFVAEDYVRRGSSEVSVRCKLRRWIPVAEVPTTPIPDPDLRHGYSGTIPSWPAGARGWD